MRVAVQDVTRGQERLGLIIVGDGATNVNKDPILNVLAVRGGRQEFIKAMNCKGKVKDKRFIADDFIAVIMAQPDPKAVVMVITDNACRGSWPLIEEACPWVVCGGCQPHVCDLLLEDIGKLPFFKKIFSEAAVLRTLVRGRGLLLAAYDARCKSKLVNPGDTRFNTCVIGAANLLRNREALVGTMGDGAVITAMHKVKGDKLEGQFASVGELFAHAQRQVMDPDFWTRLEWSTIIMAPIGRLLRFTEQDAPTASKVHYAWYQVQSKIEEMDIDVDLKAEIMKLVRYRWDYGYNCVIGAGYVLDPEFRLCEADAETSESFREFVLKCHPAPVAPRLFANEDEKAAFTKEKEEHSALLNRIYSQLLHYRRGDGVWGRDEVLYAMKHLSAVDFWDIHGVHAEELQYVALRALGCASGACAAERGHKFMAHTLTGDRNRLGWDKVEKMIYVQMNLPLAYPPLVPVRDVVAFELDDDEDEEMPSQPSEWAEAATDDGDDNERTAAAAAAEERSQRRVATLAARAAAVEKGRPADAEVARADGRRGIKRPAHFADFE